MCMTGATALCVEVGGKPKEWDCKDINNECSSDNLPNNYGVGACSTDAQCTVFAKSTMKICCDVIKKYMTDLICDNADKTKIDAVYVDGNYSCAHTLHCVEQLNLHQSSVSVSSPHTTIFLLTYVSVYVSPYLILYTYHVPCSRRSHMFLR